MSTITDERVEPDVAVAPARPRRRWQFSLRRAMASMPVFGAAAIVARCALDAGQAGSVAVLAPLFASVAAWLAGAACGVVAGGWRGAAVGSSATLMGLAAYWTLRLN